MRFVFELVDEGCQVRQIAKAMCERLRKQPVGEPGVAWQERAVQVRPDGAPDAAALQIGRASCRERV